MLWRGVVESFREAFAFEQGMKNVQAIAQTTTEQFELLKQRALEMGTTTRFSAKEAADAMVVMAQAGMSADEILKSIKETAFLATATLFDLKETAKLVTTIMRAWNYEAGQSGEIVDILATSINETKLNMKDLGTAFNYVTGVAPQVNLSLKETTAMLGLMANRGIKASTAATSLRALLAALLKPSGSFKDELTKLGLVLDDVNPAFYSIQTILEKLQKAGWGAAESYNAFRRRAAGGATVLIESADSLRDLTDRMHQYGRAQTMAEQQLNTVQSQWKLFKDSAIEMAAVYNQNLTPGLMLLIKGLKGLLSALNILKPVLIVLNAGVSLIADGFRKLTESDAAASIREGREELARLGVQAHDTESDIQRLVETYRQVRESFIKYKTALATGKSRGGQSQLDLEERALELAKNAGLISAEEIERIKLINTKEEARLKLETEINESYMERQRTLAKEYIQLNKNLKLIEEAATAVASSKMQDANTDLKEAIEGQRKMLELRKYLLSEKGALQSHDPTKLTYLQQGGFAGLAAMTSSGAAEEFDENLNKAAKDYRIFFNNLTDTNKQVLLETDETVQKFFDILSLAGGKIENFARANRELVDRELSIAKLDTGEGNPFAGLKDLEGPSDAEIIEAQRILNEKANAAAKEKEKKSLKEQEAIMKANAKHQEAINDRALSYAKERSASAKVINDLELNTLNIQRDALVASKGYAEEESEKIAIKAEILKLDTQIALKQSEGRRNTNAWVGAMYDLKSEWSSGTETWREAFKTSAKSVSDTGSNAIMGLVRGFPEAQEKAAGLKGELEGLEQQYKEAIGEGRVEDAKNLKEQMGELDDQIDDLEDPIKNVGNAFKEMGKGIIDTLQQVIQEMIAAKIAAYLFGEVLGTSGGSGSYGMASGNMSGANESSGMNWGGLITSVLGGVLGFGSGGVMPQVKAFKSFSTGGITGNTTMALLGDNPSKKELVIPSENIKSNKVEGYTRDREEEKQPINILNVLTKSDIASAISGSEGRRVIVNHIGRDLNNNGPTAKKLGR